MANNDPTLNLVTATRGSPQIEPVQQSSLGPVIPHAVNQLAFGIPEGMARGQGVGGKIDEWLKGLPSTLIEKAGGKQQLLKALGTPSPLGEAIGVIGSGLGGGLAKAGVSAMPKVGKALVKGATGVIGSGATQAAGQAVRSSNVGDENAPMNIGIAGLGGLAGGAIGKGMAAKAGAFNEAKDAAKAAGVKNPMLTDAMHDANLKYLANALPEMRGADVRQFEKNLVNLYNGAPKIREEISGLAERVRELGLDDPTNRAKFIAAQPARWQAADQAVAQADMRLFKPKINAQGQVIGYTLPRQIEQLPSVQEYRAAVRGLPPSVVQDKFDMLLARADGLNAGPPGTGLYHSVNPANFSATRKALINDSNQLFKNSQNPASGVDIAVPQSERLLAAALDDVRDLYTDKGIGLIAGTNPKLASEMKADYALAKFLNKGDTRLATDLAGQRDIANSVTAFSTSPQNIIRNTLGPLARKATNTMLGSYNKATSGLAASSLAKPAGGVVGEAMTAANAVAPALASMPKNLGKAAQFTMAPGNIPPEDRPVQQPVQQPVQTAPPPSGGTNLNIPAPVYADTQQNRAETPAIALPPLKAKAYDGKYGDYPSSAVDDKIMAGVDNLFDTQMRGRYIGNPREEAKAREEFRQGAMEALHRNQDGSIDTMIAARVLFPGQAQQQEQFTSAAQTNMAITQAIKSGAIKGGGLPGFKQINQYLRPSEGAAFQTLQAAAAKELGQAGVEAVDSIVRGPKSEREKEQLIRRLFEQGPNANGWRLYNQTFGGTP